MKYITKLETEGGGTKYKNIGNYLDSKHLLILFRWCLRILLPLLGKQFHHVLCLKVRITVTWFFIGCDILALIHLRTVSIRNTTWWRTYYKSTSKDNWAEENKFHTRGTVFLFGSWRRFSAKVQGRFKFTNLILFSFYILGHSVGYCV